MKVRKERGSLEGLRFGGVVAAACALVVLIANALFPLPGALGPEAAACEGGSDELLFAEGSASPSEGEAGDGKVSGDAVYDYCSAVPEMVQYPEMPAGCEIYSLSAVIRSLGFDADPHAVVARHLPFSPVDGMLSSAYSGDPYVAGEGLPPAIVIAGNSFLEEAGSAARFSDATGSSFEDLERIANEGIPVLVWTTMSLQDPGLASPLPPYTFYPLEHCLVLLGSEGEDVRTMDPMVGFASYDREWFRQVFELCGSMTVTLLP